MTPPTPEHPRFTPVADHALLVEFADVIGEEAHAAVLRLDAALADRSCPGFIEAIPAYVSLLVDFDPLATDHSLVERHVRQVLERAVEVVHRPTLHEVAVCYETPFAPDLDAVSRRTGLSLEAVINAHLAGTYQVYMYGFAPGYAYLAGVPTSIQLDRKPAPVRGIAAGSVLIAGPQCIVTTLTMPTGWWVIGRSPAKILTGDAGKPVLFEVGDRIRFHRISADDLAVQARGTGVHG
ncbi:MAG: allophanate hydrolase subunit 1 [Hyphomicrobiaceae bacterium]